ncbi:hypothetical protein BpHYR1_002773 [Brachionus plicatilis]|uniref:Uncharacterized protein n=1 Tax=Brachionus plicatilis TaxID=10195 RepID=A0A3M7SZF2_BRAPC|nr:hypothetical protein BpHYR1_002773 [Brachionus plicatilis]
MPELLIKILFYSILEKNFSNLDIVLAIVLSDLNIKFFNLSFSYAYLIQKFCYTSFLNFKHIISSLYAQFHFQIKTKQRNNYTCNCIKKISHVLVVFSGKLLKVVPKIWYPLFRHNSQNAAERPCYIFFTIALIGFNSVLGTLESIRTKNITAVSVQNFISCYLNHVSDGIHFRNFKAHVKYIKSPTYSFSCGIMAHSIGTKFNFYQLLFENLIKKTYIF